jgi:hypothetical protein
MKANVVCSPSRLDKSSNFFALAGLSRFDDARRTPRPLSTTHGGWGRGYSTYAERRVKCSVSRSTARGDSNVLGGGMEEITGGPIRELLRRERLFILETNIDDLSPQVMAYAMEELISAGGLDVWAVPILMKKGRPGTKINVLCEAKFVDLMIRIILTVSRKLKERRAGTVVRVSFSLTVITRCRNKCKDAMCTL